MRPFNASLGNALGVMLAMLVGVTACGAPALVKTREGAFEQAVSSLALKRPVVALRGAHRYLVGVGPDDPRYDRAYRVMAQAAEAIGLRYAASIWYLQIAQGGRDPAMLPFAIEGLMRLIESGPHDQDLIVSGYLAAADLAALPASTMAFVDYHAGLDSLRRGESAWAEQRFARVPRQSPYHWRVRYAQAVAMVARGELDAAQAALEALLVAANDPNREPSLVADLPGDVHTETLRTLARLHFEGRRWELALGLYDQVRARIPTDPTLLLEMAWTHFYSGSTRRALGLLVALDAPDHASLIAPERYLLEAMALRRLCQFEPARRAALRLRERYADVFTGIESGAPLTAIPGLVAGADRDPAVAPLATLEASLRRELALVDELGDRLEPELRTTLDALYGRGLTDIGRRKSALAARASERLADDLLSARDDVRFATHELAVALLRGRQRPEGPRERDPGGLGPTSGRVVYRFVDEFWNDELDDLIVLAEDRCIE